MADKKSAYWKLKEENQRLRTELYWVVCHPESSEANAIRHGVKMMAEMEKCIWFGNAIKSKDNGKA